jgi:hypothetical protein
MTYNPDQIGRLKFLKRFGLPSLDGDEVGLYADDSTGHLVQKDSLGNVIDLAVMAGQQDSVGFDTTLLYNFDTTAEGWTVNVSNTLTWVAAGGGAIDVVDLNAAAVLIARSPAGLTINGGMYSRVKALVTRLSGSGGTCSCLYTTGGHAESASFIKTIPLPVALGAVGGAAVIDFDMENLTVGGTDWIDNTITRIRIDLGNSVNVDDSFRIHWVAVGRNAPPLVSASTVAGAANQIQYNSGSSSLAASANLTFDPGTNTQAVPNILLDSALLDSTLPTAGDIKTGARKNALILPRHIDEFGAEYLSSPAFWQKNFSMFSPNNATTGTGTVIGGTWTSSGTVTHPTPATTNRGTTQHRTRWANVVTTQNQILGALPTVSQVKHFRGNANAKMGGFLYYARFVVEFPASTVRIFAGMHSAQTGTIIQSDTPTSSAIGFWHDTANPLSGAGAWNFITIDGIGTTEAAITPSVALATGQLYEAWIYAPAGASSPVLYKLVLLENGSNTVIAEGQSTTNLPINTMSCPLMLTSNGTANIAVNTTATNICNITCIETN